jgi:SAM-dependent methyltransferase
MSARGERVGSPAGGCGAAGECGGSMTAQDFEARYRAQGDPWGYRTSAYEHDKYRATLEACGEGPFACALELGSSIGVFSAMLAPRCRRLTTIDFAPTAVAAARRRLRAHPQVSVRLGTIPEALAPGPYDLVVASEILYYLDDPALAGTLATLRRELAPARRLVAVHWIPPGPERPRDARAAHAALAAAPWLERIESRGTAEYLLEVFARR